ncbi:MAG TPA: prephenate dehydrogenase/arogenate dehydrogenase family protein [Vicinamibacterales bacterium]
MAIRDRWPESRVFGVDSDSVVAHALGGGAIERGFETIDALPDVSLIVLAAPVGQNIELLREISRKKPVESGFSRTITDVGGTKRAIVNAARALPPGVTFVGGHPLGGGERGGFSFARPDLFAGRPWIFTPDGDGTTDAVERLSRLVTGLRAKPVIIPADEHDRVMAFVSHLPQLAASALMDAVGGAAHAEGLRMAGRGLVDTTRLASSPADVWRDICLTNADCIEGALDCLIQRLTQLRGDLRRGDAVEAIFSAAARWRAELMKDNH